MSVKTIFGCKYNTTVDCDNLCIRKINDTIDVCEGLTICILTENE